MKKFFAVVLCLCLVLTMVACGGKSSSSEYKLGMGVVAAASGEGKATLGGTVATVVMDSDGKIVDCKIDTFDNSVGIEGGKLNADDLTKTFKTKYELGNDYAMKQYSGIQKEWFEQADFFADYVEGLDADGVAALANTAKDDSVLRSGCTIDVSEFIKAVVAACNDKYAKSFKASDYKLGVAVVSAVAAGDSSDVVDGEGKVKFSVNVSAAVADKDGKTVAALVDTLEPTVKFDAAGKVTNAADKISTKKELGADYGMKQYSGIGKEWFEQAGAFEDFIAGLDATGINSIALNADKKAEDGILKAGCSMMVDGFIGAAFKAVTNAK